MTRAATRFWICLLLLLAVAAVYAKIAWAGFVNLDDPNYFSANPRVLSGLTWSGIHWAFTTFWFSNWHPLTWVSYMLDVSLFGPSPMGPHLVSVAFHAVNTLLLFLLLNRMTGATWRSALVAALFALHPLHVESVAWISERKDVLSVLCTLATLHAYLGYARGGSRRSLAFSVFWYALALMAKPMPVSLPILLVLLDRWPLGRATTFSPWKLRALILEKWPFAALAAVSCFLTIRAQGAAIVGFQALTFSMRVSNASWAYMRYLGKTVWPSGLSVIYPLSSSEARLQLGLAGALSFLALGVITWFFIDQRGKRPYLLVGWAWFLVSLVPVIGLVQVGSQAIADRYTYLPLIGPFILAAWGASDLLGKWNAQRWLACALSLALCGILAGLSWVQAGYWSSSSTLFQHSLDVNPKSPLALLNLGQTLAAQGRNREALAYYERACQISASWELPRKSLAVARYNLGEPEQALSQAAEALARDPEDGDMLFLAGKLLLFKGLREESVQCLRHFQALEPRRLSLTLDHHKELAMSQEARIMLGLTAQNLHWTKEACRNLEEARQRDPGNPTILMNLGAALGDAGRPGEALTHLRLCARIKPRSPEVHRLLGKVLRQAGNVREGEAELRLAAALEAGGGGET